MPALLELLQRYARLRRDSRAQRWDERDVVMITYGDQISRDGETPLQTLNSLLVETGLNQLINTVHILPFCPYTSDDGFSVVDYRAVDPALGSWDDIQRLGEHQQLMFDLVLNHASQKCNWFQGYLDGDPKYLDYFIEMDPNEDLSQVTRPRSWPLLTPFETSRGTRHIWTTFSADQVDLNYADPAVLIEMLDVFLFYIQQGARIVRLDAIAYLWKEVGTSCIHLPETHAVVKLMRDVIDLVAPHVILLTETNVPHAENISYFGDGDEAHMVYQFSLPPLLLDALLSQDATAFNHWLRGLKPAGPGTTFFNFTASHDGIGVRPLEGLVPPERVAELVEAVQARDGRVGTKRNPDGSDSPYELNITYVDALKDPESNDPAENARRFLVSQAVMLSLQGIPGVYFHSLFGTSNDLEGVAASGIPRRINRRKFKWSELHEVLSDPDSLQARILGGYRHLLEVRTEQPAFHPDAEQKVCDTDAPCLIAFERTSLDESQRILVVANLSADYESVDVAQLTQATRFSDLLNGQQAEDGQFSLAPYQVAWLQLSS
jgi:sucrose phosphorylase